MAGTVPSFSGENQEITRWRLDERCFPFLPSSLSQFAFSCFKALFLSRMSKLLRNSTWTMFLSMLKKISFFCGSNVTDSALDFLHDHFSGPTGQQGALLITERERCKHVPSPCMQPLFDTHTPGESPFLFFSLEHLPLSYQLPRFAPEPGGRGAGCSWRSWLQRLPATEGLAGPSEKHNKSHITLTETSWLSTSPPPLLTAPAGAHRAARLPRKTRLDLGESENYFIICPPAS